MNRELGERSMVQDMIGEGHAWWSSNSTLSSSSSSSSLCFSNSPCTQPSSSLLPATPWTNINPPESLSQLLLNGLVGGDERRSCMPFQSKKLDDYNWEDQLVYPTTNAHDLLCLKQENYETNNNGYIYFHGDEEIQTFSPRSCATTSSLENNSMLNFSHKFEQKFEHQQQPDISECFSNENGTPFKKARIQASPQSSVKVRKEKLGDRITALHQIVSPFGKTDTASVLLEAIGYIRFLHGQIQVLSSPYLISEGGTTHSRHHGKEERNCIFPEDSGQLSNDNSKKQSPQSDQGKKEEDQKRDLRSKGLCLVPVSFPLDIGTDHLITDYWAPAFGVNFTQ